MALAILCPCGETLRTVETPAPAYLACARCQRRVPVTPEAVAAAAQQELARESHCELVRDAEGHAFWKLTCQCGKRLRTPLITPHPYGTCPKCRARLKLPGFLLRAAAQAERPVRPARAESPGGTEAGLAAPSAETALKPGAAPGAGVRQPGPGESTVAYEAGMVPPVESDDAGGELDFSNPPLIDDDTETVHAEVVLADMRVSQGAFERVADGLRPHQVSALGPRVPATGRITAWPLAGVARRALAGFIDATLALFFAAGLLLLARFDILPPVLLKPGLLALWLLLGGLFADVVLPLLLGESAGKRLVVAVTRNVGGGEPGVLRVVARGVLKWLLIPGWFVALADPHERTLHDLLCQTLVLRGRLRRGKG